MRKINWKTTPVVFNAALAFALFSGPSAVIAQTNNAGPNGQNCVAMGGGAPSGLKTEKQRNCIAMGGASPSILRKAPQKKDGNFKVEIEGINPKPAARSK